MKNITLRGFVETAGLISVVASLVFVGMQLRQDQDIALASQYQARAETSSSNYRSRIESEAFISALAKVRTGDHANLTPEEEVAYELSVLIDLVNADNDYYQYQMGYVSDEYWEGRRSRLKNRLREERVRRVFTTTLSPESFFHFVEELLAEIDSE